MTDGYEFRSHLRFCGHANVGRVAARHYMSLVRQADGFYGKHAEYLERAVHENSRAQITKKWHATQLGELGVPDRYVDIFQGRAPKTVLAQYYTGKELSRLREIYEKADLRVLDQP